MYSAQAKVKEPQLNLGYTTIRSPVTGFASRASQRQGAYINSMSESAKLTYVAALDPIWVNFSVSQNQLAKVKDQVAKGQLMLPPDQDFEVEIVLPGGQAIPSGPHQLRRSLLQPGDRLVPRARGAAQSEQELMPGMFVTANVHGRHARERRLRAAARGAAGPQRPRRLRHQGGRHGRGAPGGSRRLSTARRTSSSAPACKPETASWSTAR